MEEHEENIKASAEGIVPEVMDGRRIVELKFLSEQLWCISCKEALSLQFVETEICRGLASVLLVRCHKCLLVNEVITNKTHRSGDRYTLRYVIIEKSLSQKLTKFITNLFFKYYICFMDGTADCGVAALPYCARRSRTNARSRAIISLVFLQFL